MKTLLLVNQNHRLSRTFIPCRLVQDSLSGVWICQDALEAFYRLNQKLVEQNLDPLVLISGYRSYTYQEKLFNKKVHFFKEQGLSNREAKKEATRIVARPGHSEHQLGLAIDVTVQSMSLLEDPLITGFENTNTSRWLIKYSYLEGFILRYPKDKMAVTHITYEPWHYRYVGIEAATFMQHHHLCLEEYVSMQKANRLNNLGGINEEL